MEMEGRGSCRAAAGMGNQESRIRNEERSFLVAGRRPNATGVYYSSLGVAAGDPRKTPRTDSDAKGVAESSGTPLAFASLPDRNLGSPGGDAHTHQVKPD